MAGTERSPWASKARQGPSASKSSWKDNGSVIITRELKRWSRSRKLRHGPIQIIRMSGDRYVLRYHHMKIALRDGRGVIGGVLWPERNPQQPGGAGPYRQRTGLTEALRRYRDRRARAVEKAMTSAVETIAWSQEHDVRAFLFFGSYVRAIRNVLAFAQMTKAEAHDLQRTTGYICLDHRDELALRPIVPRQPGR